MRRLTCFVVVGSLLPLLLVVGCAHNRCCGGAACAAGGCPSSGAPEYGYGNSDPYQAQPAQGPIRRMIEGSMSR